MSTYPKLDMALENAVLASSRTGAMGYSVSSRSKVMSPSFFFLGAEEEEGVDRAFSSVVDARAVRV